MAVKGNSIPFVKSQFFTDNGVVAASYLLYVYIAGTSELATTFSDWQMSTENANPITLDSAGRASIFLDRKVAYKFILVDPADTTNPQTSNLWSRDTILPPPFYAMDDSTVRDEVSVVGWSTTFSIPVGNPTPDTPQFLNAPYQPVILYNKYVNSGSKSDDITIPAGTFVALAPSNTGASLILEWEVDYGSATLSARSEAFGTAVDLGTGSASTHTRARYVFYRVDSTSVYVSTTVSQDTGAGNIQTICGASTIGSLNLTTTDYTVDMKMSAGSYVIRGARAFFGRPLGDWTAL